MLNNTNPSLATAASAGGEPDLAVNPANPSQISIASFDGSWGAGNVSIFYSTNGGLTWTVESSIPRPPGLSSTQVNGCPCDQTFDFGRDGRLYGTFLIDDFVSSSNVVTGSTNDPTSPSAWQWNVNSSGVAQTTNISNPNNADQPWLVVNRDPVIVAQDDVYVGYYNIGATLTAQVAGSYGVEPVDVTSDQQAGTTSTPPSQDYTNLGVRPAPDPLSGALYVLYQQPSPGSADPKTVIYTLNRSTDGGRTWSLSGNANGFAVSGSLAVPTDQGYPFKFGTVNALFGGVDHAAVDPSTEDVYVVYGEDTNLSSPGLGNQLFVARVHVDGSGNASVVRTTQLTTGASAALPSIAVASDGVVGVLYDSDEGIASDGFPKFSAHLAQSVDGGQSFTDQVLSTFESPSTDNGNSSQRVLGDYQQLKSVGTTFFGVFSGNRAAFGSAISAIDPVFFQVPDEATVLHRVYLPAVLNSAP